MNGPRLTSSWMKLTASGQLDLGFKSKNVWKLTWRMMDKSVINRESVFSCALLQ